MAVNPYIHLCYVALIPTYRDKHQLALMDDILRQISALGIAETLLYILPHIYISKNQRVSTFYNVTSDMLFPRVYNTVHHG